MVQLGALAMRRNAEGLRVMQTDSIIEGDPGWQSLANAVRKRSRDYLHVRTTQAGLCDPARNMWSIPHEEWLQVSPSWRGDSSMEELDRMQPYDPRKQAGFGSVGLFGALFGRAF
jgi:hypothetical protein